MESRILVTGATGNVGGEVVRQLCARGAAPLAMVHAPQKGEPFEALGADACVADLRDPGPVRAALDGVDVLFMLTPVAPDMVPIGVALAQAAADAGVKRIVKLSALHAERDDAPTLPRWHREVEIEIERVGIPWTFLRPPGFMQMMAGTYTATVPAQGVFYLPCGDAAVCKVDARDVAAVAVEALLSDAWEGQGLTPTGPEALTYAQMAQIMSDAAGREIHYVDVPEQATRDALAQVGVPEPMLSAFLGLYALDRSGGAAVVTDDVERVTGKPARSFAAFAGENAAAWAPAAS